MKKITILLYLLCCSISIAQTVDVVTVPEVPTRIAVLGNDLYFSGASLVSSTLGRIYKVDVTNPLPITPTLVYDGPSPNDLLFIGNELYIAQFWENKIVKMDVTIGQSSITDVITTSSNPSGLLLIGNDLFYSEVNGGTLSKIDITNSTATPIVVLNTLTSPYDLLWHNNELYISELSRISKVDPYSTTPTKIDVITTGITGVLGMRFYDNMIYTADQITNKVIKFDPTLANPILIDVITGLNRPVEVAIINDALYISIMNSFKLVKFDTLLDVEDNHLSETVIYPNPTSESFQIKIKSSIASLEIFDFKGKEIMNIPGYQGEKLNVSHLDSGMYFIKVFLNKSNHTFKLFKN